MGKMDHCPYQETLSHCGGHLLCVGFVVYTNVFPFPGRGMTIGRDIIAEFIINRAEDDLMECETVPHSHAMSKYCAVI
jgi:hypothetical protein